MSTTSTRRGLLAGGASAAAALGYLAGASLPTGATQPDGDAELLALCDRLETVQRRFNSLWLQGCGPRYYAPGSYIADDDEREAAAAPLEQEADGLFDRILEILPNTMDGVRAIARCIMLAECDLRDGPDKANSEFSLSDRGAFIMHKLIHDLAGGGITEQNCMVEPGVLAPQTPEPKFVVRPDHSAPYVVPVPTTLEHAIRRVEAAEQMEAVAARIAAEARRRVDELSGKREALS
jgi:hypothetical protein